MDVSAFTKPLIFFENGAWHVMGGDWDQHLAAYDFTVRLNGSNR